MMSFYDPDFSPVSHASAVYPNQTDPDQNIDHLRSTSACVDPGDETSPNSSKTDLNPDNDSVS
jgi:hypothetical protein